MLGLSTCPHPELVIDAVRDDDLCLSFQHALIRCSGESLYVSYVPLPAPASASAVGKTGAIMSFRELRRTLQRPCMPRKLYLGRQTVIQTSLMPCSVHRDHEVTGLPQAHIVGQLQDTKL
jgi:hypothetical protein